MICSSTNLWAIPAFLFNFSNQVVISVKDSMIYYYEKTSVIFAVYNKIPQHSPEMSSLISSKFLLTNFVYLGSFWEIMCGIRKSHKICTKFFHTNVNAKLTLSLLVNWFLIVILDRFTLKKKNN